MQNDADKWKKRGEALRKAIEETAEMTAKDSKERQDVIDEIRKWFFQSDHTGVIRTVVGDREEVVEEKLTEEQKEAGYELFIKPYTNYLSFERRQIALCGQLGEFLKEFGRELYDFFLQGFYSDNSKLKPSGVYPPGYVLRTLLDQISTDLYITQAAIHQRRHPNFKFGDDTDTTKNGTNISWTTLHAWSLYQADILSEHALQVAQESGFLHQYTPVVTYFEKNLSTRLVPYYDLLLIGIPYSTFAENVGYSIHISQENITTNKNPLSADLLAIPHEVGHYLYWKGRVPGSELTVQTYLWNRLEKARIRPWDWRWQWLEELFADAYSCLVAGPVSVLNFQDLLTDNLPEHFRQDPAKHPIPILRPFIQSRILRKIKTADGNALYRTAPDRLDAEWESSIEKRLFGDADQPLPLAAKYRIQGVPQLIKGEEIVNAVDEVVDLILEALPVPRPADASPSWTPWTSDLAEATGDVAALYPEFLNKLFYPQEAWIDYKASKLDWALQSFRKKLKDVTVNAGDRRISESEWTELFLVRGWSTEGPESNGFR